MDFVYFPLIKLEESRFTKDFEGPYTNRNPPGCFGIQFWKFFNLRKKKNGKADKIHFTVLCRWRDTHRLLSWAFPIICLIRRLEKTSLSASTGCRLVLLLILYWKASFFQLSDNFFAVLFSKVTHTHKILVWFWSKIINCTDTRAFQTIRTRSPGKCIFS